MKQQVTSFLPLMIDNRSLSLLFLACWWTYRPPDRLTEQQRWFMLCPECVLRRIFLSVELAFVASASFAAVSRCSDLAVVSVSQRDFRRWFNWFSVLSRSSSSCLSLPSSRSVLLHCRSLQWLHRNQFGCSIGSVPAAPWAERDRLCRHNLCSAYKLCKSNLCTF